MLKFPVYTSISFLFQQVLSCTWMKPLCWTTSESDTWKTRFMWVWHVHLVAMATKILWRSLIAMWKKKGACNIVWFLVYLHTALFSSYNSRVDESRGKQYWSKWPPTWWLLFVFVEIQPAWREHQYFPLASEFPVCSKCLNLCTVSFYWSEQKNG